MFKVPRRGSVNPSPLGEWVKCHADLLWALGCITLLLRRLLGLGGTRVDDPAWFMTDLLWGDLKSILVGDTWRVRLSQTH
jgi:hypothetical protein